MNRYEAELSKLLESQKHNRSKTQQKMMDKILLRKRKQAASDNFASLENADEMLESAEEESKKVLREEEARAQAVMIRPLLLAISAAEIMDPTLVTPNDGGEHVT